MQSEDDIHNVCKIIKACAPQAGTGDQQRRYNK